MKTIERILREKGILLALSGILCIYFGAICLINFSGRPGFYCTDMYTDMLFAAKAWEQKSLIPDGWVFGNQLYVVATPALAALFCGVVPNPQQAMAIAAVFMMVLVLITFYWMLKPVMKREENMLCIVLFMALSLFYGDAVSTANGWQLFFTLCGYYACYLINVFLAFGCYIRADRPIKSRFCVLLFFTCILSFCTGIQSLRQTAVMSVPLGALAGIRLLADIRKGEKINRRSLVTAALICVSNLMGLLFKKTIDLDQTEIFGQMGIAKLADMIPAVGDSLKTMLDLLSGESVLASVVRIALLGGSVLAVGILFFRKNSEQDKGRKELAVLIILSILTILAIDVGTTMDVRSIYYFMLYLLLAFLISCGCSFVKKLPRILFLVGILLSLVLPGMIRLKDTCIQALLWRYDRSYAVSEYLMEEGFSTIYAQWDMGEDFAIASEFRLQAGFWGTDTFVPIMYLCDPEVYTRAPEACAYLFFWESAAQNAEELAASRNLPITLHTYLPEQDIYIYTSSVNLMQEFGK